MNKQILTAARLSGMSATKNVYKKIYKKYSILFLIVFALLPSATSYSVEYSTCKRGAPDYLRAVCDESDPVENIEEDFVRSPPYTGWVFRIERGIYDIGRRAKCDYCRPGAGGPHIKGPNNNGFINQYFAVPVKQYKPDYEDCEYVGSGAPTPALYDYYAPFDGPDGWARCDSLFDSTTVRVRCEFNSRHPDGDPNCEGYQSEPTE